MSTDRPVVPYGSWPSPITASLLVGGAASVGEIRSDGDDVWWSEQRPEEGGRTQLVRRTRAGTRQDLFAPFEAGTEPVDARTAYLEYGGGAWNVRGGVVVYVDWSDQRLHRIDRGGDPVPLTPEPSVPRGFRWSEPSWLDEHWLIVARESHEPEAVARNGEAVNEIVAVPLDGSAVDDPDRVRVLTSTGDFVHTPAVAGDRLTWIRWDHPRMPWDGTELVLATVDREADGAPVGLVDERVVAGGPTESVVQPGFDRDGHLVFCSDRTGWWAPYRFDGETIDPLLSEPAEMEIGGPLWVGGLRWWTQTADGRFAVVARSDSTDRLGVIDTDGTLHVLPTPFTEMDQITVNGSGRRVLVVAATPTAEAAPYAVGIEVDPVDDEEPDVAVEKLRRGRDLGLAPGAISIPEHRSFESANGRIAHLLHYPPTNPAVRAPADERPPLIVMIHGGPTSAVRHRFDLAKQFWTSRGFAVADVDYGGSVGYGRPYRDLLQGGWGVVDVEDAVAAARSLADEGLVDPDRLAIRGGSAGGYTTLAALCFHDVFAAGASHYGIADLSALAADTHKFESRYLDGIVGRFPEERERYEARSPIHHTEGFDRPLIVLQGSEDEIVPPNQAEMIVAALAERGVPHAYLLFEGEQHGFRRADNIVRALEAELWFYGRVFGFEPVDRIEPVEGAIGL